MAGGMIKEWQVTKAVEGGRWETAAGISDSRFYIETGGKTAGAGSADTVF